MLRPLQLRRSPLLRIGALLLALWHFSTSTELAVAAADWLAPSAKIVAVADFPCATHDCCCKSREECAKHCCCFPHWSEREFVAVERGSGAERAASPGVHAPAGKLVRVRLSASSKCQGGPAKAARATDAKLPFVTAGAAPPLEPPAVAKERHARFVGIRPEEPPLEGPGKVPLAGARAH